MRYLMFRVWTAVSLGTLFVSVAASATACPSCFSAVDGRVLDAYYFGVVLLSLLPFAIMAGIFFAIRSLSRGASENETT